MADHYAISLLGAMDRLWFHQIILVSIPSSLLFPETLKNTLQPQYSSSNISQLPLLEEENSSTASFITPSEDDCNNQHDEEDDKKETQQNLKGPTKESNSTTTESRSYSSSPLNHRIYPRRMLRSYSGSVMMLQKTMSCKTLSELELEEVKGFIDLGFEFKRENLSPRMMRVVPGLQRIEWDPNEEIGNESEDCDHEVIEEEEEEEERGGILRPYLSEAWIYQRPLLNLRVPRVYAAADMKKHLRSWARTVASVIRQDS